MSDDEYFYDEFDEFHEMLYDADPAPELADDLAERAAYSPVWQDNPTEELRDYFSDWEYYSDDYFDDDPKLLNGEAKDGTNQQRSIKHSHPSLKRGRKRKLSEARELPKIKKREMDALVACLQGTVWKGQSPEPAIGYKVGEDQPVALRLNADIMRSAYSKKHGFGKFRLNREESWANELSLEDMGLKTERSMSFHERPNIDKREDGDDEYEEDEAENAIDDEDMVDEIAVETETMVEEPHRVQLQTELDPIESGMIQSQIDGQQSPRKRRKLSASNSVMKEKPTLPTPDASIESELSETGTHANGQVQLRNSAKAKRGKSSKRNTESHISEEEGEERQSPKTGAKKRKLSMSESAATASTASSRAKRVAFSREADEEKPILKTAASTRPSRSRKK